MRFFCLLALLCPLIIHAQPVTTRFAGNVVSTDQSPLPGVTVQLQKSGKRTITNKDGVFSFDKVQIPDTVIITHVGFSPFRFTINAVFLKDVTLSLQPTAEELQQVTVVSTGYQQIPKERITGSVVTVGRELLNRRVSTNIIDRIDGVTSGVLFNKSNSADELLSIRGRSTLLNAAAATPLIVLDNFPYEGNINTINPNDVENITILKDAAAASIWGARSANGVIVITSKKGRASQKIRTEVNFNNTFFERPDLFYSKNFLSTPNYLEAEAFLFGKGYYDANLANVTTFPAVTPGVEILAARRAGTITAAQADEQLAALRNIDVRNDIQKYFYRAAMNTQGSVAVSGGSATSNYRLSVGFDRNLLVQQANDYSRASINLQHTLTPIKTLEIATGIIYTNSATKQPNSFSYQMANYTSNAVIYPYALLADANGNALSYVRDYRAKFVDSLQQKGFLDWRYYPLAERSYNRNNQILNNLLLRLSAKVQVWQGWNVQLQLQQEEQRTQNENYQSPESYAVKNQVNKFSLYNTSTGTITYQMPKGGFLNLYNGTLRSTSVRLQMNGVQYFGKDHRMDVLAGAEARQTKSGSYSRAFIGYDDVYGLSVENLNFSTSFQTTPSGTSTLPRNTSSISETVNRYISYYANVAYSYRKKYTFTISGRKDGANIFGVNTNQKIVPLWSAGASWDLAKEKFYHLELLPEARLRISYGYNGNVYNGSAFLIARYLTSSMTGVQAAQVVSPPNASLRWERVRNINVGFDFAFKRFLSGSVEVYRKDAMDLIEDQPLPPSTGFIRLTGNAAATRTNGIDIILNTTNLRGQFYWTTNVLFSTLNDRVIRFDKQYLATALASGTGGLIALEGKSLFGIYSYPNAGLDPTNGDPQGYYKGSISKDYTNILRNTPIDSLVYHGSARPTVFGSIRNNLTYKRWTLSVNITFKAGYYFRNRSVSINYADMVLTGGHSDYDLRWKQPGDEAYTYVPSLAYPSNTNRNDFYRYSQTLVEKADHIRLQDIRLSYQFAKGKRKAWFESLEAYGYLNNIGLLWRANHSRIDPDYNDYSFTYGTSNPRSFSIGIKANF